MTEKQFITWGNFQKTKLTNKLRQHEVTLVWELHNSLVGRFKHKPCTSCPQTGKIWNGMIEDIDKLYEAYNN